MFRSGEHENRDGINSFVLILLVGGLTYWLFYVIVWIMIPIDEHIEGLTLVQYPVYVIITLW